MFDRCLILTHFNQFLLTGFRKLGIRYQRTSSDNLEKLIWKWKCLYKWCHVPTCTRLIKCFFLNVKLIIWIFWKNNKFVWHELIIENLHCPVAHSLWVYMFQIFGTQWVMPGSVESLVYCWSFWLGKFNSDIWIMVPGCLMWIVWTERNWRSFENTEKSLVQLQAFCQKTLFDWSRCWGFSECSTILEFISSLSIAL